MTKVFAEQYEREGDLILFPRDVKWRKQLFPQEVFTHPAKANLYLIKELIDYLTEPGDTILDPFGGTGSLLIGALYGRNIALVEIEPHYIQLLEETQRMWGEPVQLPSDASKDRGRIFVFEGDCRQKMKDIGFLCDAAIFSPPYASNLQAQTNIEELKEGFQKYGGKQASSQNMARLNPFYFTQAMAMVYKRMHSRLVPGAPVAIITKDVMKGPRRQFLSEGVIREANRNGYEQTEWFKWKPPGSMQQSIVKSKGFNVVTDEDILIFRRI